MAMVTKECPVCGEQFQAYLISWVIRDHIRVAHPEAEAEIRQAEAELWDIKNRIWGKYPNVYFTNG